MGGRCACLVVPREHSPGLWGGCAASWLAAIMSDLKHYSHHSHRESSLLTGGRLCSVMALSIDALAGGARTLSFVLVRPRSFAAPLLLSFAAPSAMTLAVDTLSCRTSNMTPTILTEGAPSWAGV